MGLAETRRLLERLDELGTPCRHVVVNMAMPNTGCAFCQRVREEQREVVRQAAELRPDAGRALEVPLFPHQISGMTDLRKLADAVYGRESPILARAAL